MVDDVLDLLHTEWKLIGPQGADLARAKYASKISLQLYGGGDLATLPDVQGQCVLGQLIDAGVELLVGGIASGRRPQPPCSESAGLCGQ